MIALPLFDSVLVTTAADDATVPSPSAARLARIAEQLVHSTVTDLTEIQSLDACLAPSDTDAFDPQTAVLLRGMYEQWTRDADAVLERVSKVQGMGANVAGAQDLRDAHGRLLAMLQVSLDDVQRGRRQFRQSRTWTGEEIRRELGLGI